MSDATDRPAGGGLSPDLKAGAPPPNVPTTEFVRPCERIEPGTKEIADFSTVADRFAV